jgi:GTPase
MPLKLAIVGRPNVGKSTLFNRLAGAKAALTAAEPGLTRDRREAAAALGGLELLIIDTGGFEPGGKGSLAARMRAQTEAALDAADAALFMIDARTGVTSADREIASWLRRRKRPVVLVANKAEGRTPPPGVAEAFALGFGEPVALSAEHGEGLGELYGALQPLAEAESAAIPEETHAAGKPLQLAVVGRPNVGKSTLINRLIGAERVLTGSEPGVTRDAVAVAWSWHGRPVRLIDTAGLRRKSKVASQAEKLAASDALSAIRFAEVAMLVIDAMRGLERQDLAIADLVAAEGRAMVLVANKWDLMRDRQKTVARISERLAQSLPQLAGLRPVALSAETGAGVAKLMPAVLEAYAAWNRRVPTGTLNRFLVQAQKRHPPPLVKGRRLKLRYMTQVNIRPPSFALFASRPAALPESWRRYLVNLMRDSFGLPGVPIRMMLRKSENPFVARKRFKKSL